MTGFERLGYIGSQPTIEGVKSIIVGLPYDGTSSYRSGSRFAPDEIRKASVGNLETYDPVLKADLDDYPFADLGDLQIEFGQTPEDMLADARQAVKELPLGVPFLGLGGEHSVTLSLFEKAYQSNPDLFLISFDAHTDLRDSYAGSKYSHACILRRISELISPDNIAIFGARSGTKEEFDMADKHGMIKEFSQDGLASLEKQIGNRPVYITFDLDGFDPKELPGTGTVEPGGFFWEDIVRMTGLLQELRIVGADIVELTPNLDPSGNSSILAARLARTLLLLLMKD